MGLASAYFSRGGDAHVPAREVLCLNFNFSLKAPVFADDEAELSWVVSNIEWSSRLSGWLVQGDGAAAVAQRPCVVARATLLIKPFADNVVA